MAGLSLPALPRPTLVGLLLLVLALFGAASWLQWGPWGPVIVLVVALLVAAGALLGRWIVQRWVRKKRERFDADLRSQAQGQAVREVQKQFLDALEELRRSRIDVYAIPWYLVIGEPQSGKSQVILNSGLRFPVGRDKVSGSGGTRNCDFWFTERAVLVDTAGRFAFQERNAPDQAEWTAFLRLLGRNRVRGPVNGVIVVIPATSLLGDEAEARREKARKLESRLLELQREFEIQFPVYVLVTKCDLIPGFSQTFVRLPAQQQRELFGWSKSHPFDDPVKSDAVKDGIVGLREKARIVRRRLLAEEGDVRVADEIYRFPEEFRRLEQPLAEYMEEMFRESVYRSPVFLRGVYFTSSLQKGVPIARAFRELLGTGEASEGEESALEKIFTRHRAYFIEDFFEKKVFPEKGLIRPTNEREKARRKRERVVLGAGGVLAALFAVAILGGFLNLNTAVASLLRVAGRAAGGTDGGGETRPIREAWAVAQELHAKYDEIENDAFLGPWNVFGWILGADHEAKRALADLYVLEVRRDLLPLTVKEHLWRSLFRKDAEASPAHEAAVEEAYALVSGSEAWRSLNRARGERSRLVAFAGPWEGDGSPGFGPGECAQVLGWLLDVGARASPGPLVDIGDLTSPMREAIRAWSGAWRTSLDLRLDRPLESDGGPTGPALWPGGTPTYRVALHWWRALLESDRRLERAFAASPPVPASVEEWDRLYSAGAVPAFTKWADELLGELEGLSRAIASGAEAPSLAQVVAGLRSELERSGNRLARAIEFAWKDTDDSPSRLLKRERDALLLEASKLEEGLRTRPPAGFVLDATDRGPSASAPSRPAAAVRLREDRAIVLRKSLQELRSLRDKVEMWNSPKVPDPKDRIVLRLDGIDPALQGFADGAVSAANKSRSEKLVRSVLSGLGPPWAGVPDPGPVILGSS
ncbi:MAG TPA: type VI secretion protein IcmF/TssM N-terminal domain-containing protein, partial [Planctomycetota bacterium]|nr:type VI secretion protein IcmF/TssM N-terminal domain-containing protein [Planctomycetota bacterium]